MPDLILSTNGTEPPVQPAQPAPNYNVTPQGLIITLPLAANTAMQHIIPEPVMREIIKKWAEIQREQQRIAALTADVLRTKR